MDLSWEMGLALIVQFGGIVWAYSRLTEKVGNLSVQVEDVKQDLAEVKRDVNEDRVKNAPLEQEIKGLREDIRELRRELSK